jgi:serine protease Do
MKKWMTAAAAAAALAALFVVMPVRPVLAQAPGFLTLEGAGSAIGVTVRDATAEDAKAAKLGQPAGVVIESVRTGSPAEKSGFKTGDLVLEFDGDQVRSTRQFTRLVRETPPGRTVSAVVVRDGSKQTLQVAPQVTGDFVTDARDAARRGLALRVRPDARRDFNLDVDRGAQRGRAALLRPSLGVSVAPLGTQLAEYFGVKEGALVSAVESGSAAADAGLKAGDVITAIAGRSVTTARDVTDAIRRVEPGSGVEISVTRDRKSLMLKATIPGRATPSGRGGLPV